MTTPTFGSSPEIILVVVLFFAVFAAAIIDVVIPITLVDIAHTFNILPGTVGQLNSWNNNINWQPDHFYYLLSDRNMEPIMAWDLK